MKLKFGIFGLCLLFSLSALGDELQTVVDQTLTNLTVKVSKAPYSKAIKQMLIGCDAHGVPTVGIALRKMDVFEDLIGVVIVEKTSKGFVLREVRFMEMEKIKKLKERKQLLAALKPFKGVLFDPHAEKSAVNGLSGATRHNLKLAGYLNYMARTLALEMEANPQNWKTKGSGAK